MSRARHIRFELRHAEQVIWRVKLANECIGLSTNLDFSTNKKVPALNFHRRIDRADERTVHKPITTKVVVGDDLFSGMTPKDRLCPLVFRGRRLLVVVRGSPFEVTEVDDEHDGPRHNVLQYYEY